MDEKKNNQHFYSFVLYLKLLVGAILIKLCYDNTIANEIQALFNLFENSNFIAPIPFDMMPCSIRRVRVLNYYLNLVFIHQIYLLKLSQF